MKGGTWTGLRVAIVLVLGGSGMTSAQFVFTADDLERGMRIAGRNMRLADTAIEAKDYAGAKERIARAREQVSPTAGYWKRTPHQDAQKLVRAATVKLDDLDAALSTDPVDAARVREARLAVDAACQACHAIHREQDPATKAFRIKPSSAQVAR